MLQTVRSISAGDREVAPVASPAQLYADYIAFTRRQYPVVLFVLLLLIGLGAVYIFTSPPRFTATAVMVIDSKKTQLFQQQSLFSDMPLDSATVDSQIEILKSENVALSVIKDLHLANDSEFTGLGGGLIGTVLNFVFELFGPDEPASEFVLNRKALDRFGKELTVKRVGLTYVIEISFRSLSAERAAQIANAVADAYVVDSLEAKYQTTRRAAVWLQDRLKELRQESLIAERAVVDFKQRNDIVDSGGRLMNEQQLAELNSALIQARAQVAESKARLDRITSILGPDLPDPASNETATVADTLRNEVIIKLRSQYLELANREADWSRRYGRNHLAAVHLRNQMQEIRRSIADELRRTSEVYKSDYEISKSREDAVQKSLAEIVLQSQVTNQAQIELRGLESTASTYRALHDNFLQRYMESVQQQSFPISEARLITQATRPLNKSSPKTLLVIAIAAGGGLVLGIGLGVLRDLSDRVFRTSDQVEGTLRVDCLAVVPNVQAAVSNGSTDPDPPASSGPRAIASLPSILRTITDSPFSRFAESIRSIKVAADLSRAVKSNKIIAITSSLPNEGKTTIAVSLARLIAQGGARTILVDLDLRNPSLTRKLCPDAQMGILDIVAGTKSLEDLIWTDFSTKLEVLPAVLKTRLSNTAEIVSSDAIGQLFERLRQRYDYVVVDLSPLTPVVDVRAMTHLVDSFLFIIEWGQTKIDVVDHALNAARAVQDRLLGVVLNKADVRVLGRYEHYRGNYYHNRYYARYGYTD